MKNGQKLTQDENGNPVYEIYENGKLTKTLTPLEMPHMFREKQFCYAFNRVALNPLTMKNISAPFLQIVLYKPKDRAGFDYFYFYYEKCMAMPAVKCIDSRLGRTAGFCSTPNIMDTDFVRKIGAPKRLSKEQLIEIKKTGEFNGIPYLGVFNESGHEYVSPNPV